MTRRLLLTAPLGQRLGAPQGAVRGSSPMPIEHAVGQSAMMPSTGSGRTRLRLPVGRLLWRWADIGGHLWSSPTGEFGTPLGYLDNFGSVRRPLVLRALGENRHTRGIDYRDPAPAVNTRNHEITRPRHCKCNGKKNGMHDLPEQIVHHVLRNCRQKSTIAFAISRNCICNITRGKPCKCNCSSLVVSVSRPTTTQLAIEEIIANLVDPYAEALINSPPCRGMGRPPTTPPCALATWCGKYTDMPCDALSATMTMVSSAG